MDRSSSNRIPARISSRMATVAAAVMLLVAGLIAAPPPASALPPWQDHATSWTRPAARSPKVVDLRYAAHRTFDRVVIDVVGRVPSGRAHYARRFHEDGSNALVPIRGRSGLAVTLSPARAHDGAGNNVYAGPQVARPHLQTLKALAFTGDFEGTVSFGFALTHRAPYRVSFLHSPERLVIDFQHR